MEFSELIKTATVESVLLSCAGQPAVKGTLCITSHHLLLSSCPGGDGQPSAVELWLLIRNVDAVEKRLVLSHRPVPPSVPSSMGVIPRCHPGTAEPPLPPLPRGPRQWALTSSSPPCPRVQNVGWYQPPRSSGSPRDNRFGFRCSQLLQLARQCPASRSSVGQGRLLGGELVGVAAPGTPRATGSPAQRCALLSPPGQRAAPCCLRAQPLLP